MSTPTPETTEEALFWLRRVYHRETDDRRQLWTNRFIRRHKPYVFCETQGRWLNRTNPRVSARMCQDAGDYMYYEEDHTEFVDHHKTIHARINAKIMAAETLKRYRRWWRQLTPDTPNAPSFIPLMLFAIQDGWISRVLRKENAA